MSIVDTNIAQVAYLPKVLVARHPVGATMATPLAVAEPFVFPAAMSSIGPADQAMRVFLDNLGFDTDWIDMFLLAANEAISNACQSAPPDSSVRCLLIVIGHGSEQFVSLCVDNDLPIGQSVALPRLEQAYDFADHISDTRGRGFEIMKAVADGMVVTLVPDRTIQTILEKDHRREG